MRITRKQWAEIHAVHAPEGCELPASLTAKEYQQSGKPRGTPEQNLQIECCDYLRTQTQLLFFSCPNHIFMGGADDDATYGKQANYMAKQRRMGLTPGVSDLVIIGRNAHGATAICFAELKAPGGGRITTTQAAFQDKANGLGCYTAVVRSLDELKTLLFTANL